MQVVQLGPLEARQLESPEFQVRPESERTTLVLLHGFGVPSTDLTWLSEALVALASENGDPLQVILPAAPHALDPATPHGGRLWFPIDMAEFGMALLGQRWDELAAYRPTGLPEASEQLEAALSSLSARTRGRLVVGGFSQGALVTAHWALRTALRPTGLVLLSAMMMCESEWQPLMSECAGLPVFQVHPSLDPVVPYDLGCRLRTAMRDSGMHVAFHETPPGHYIHVSVAELLTGWLRELTGPNAL
jgi:phospholipase/carboxylesterase